MKIDIEELKRLAFEYKSRPDLQVNEVAFRNAANPAAVLELIRQGKELAKQCAEWERLSRNWLASSEAAQRLSGYQSLARKASDACDVAEKLQAELLAERARPVPAAPATHVLGADDQLATLMRFYQVSDIPSLALAQAEHVERLQAKLPAMRDDMPRNPRGA